jgi:hypothetical protein
MKEALVADGGGTPFGQAGSAAATSAGTPFGQAGSKPAAPKKKAAPATGQYTVKKGDTLSGIAAANNTSLAALRKANPQMTAPGSKYKNGNMIWSGTKVNLGGATGGGSAGGGRGVPMSPAGNRPRGAAAGMKSGNTLLGKIGSAVGAVAGGTLGAIVPGLPMLGAAKKASAAGNKLGNAVSPMISKKQFGVAGGIAAGGIIGAGLGAARGAALGPVGAAGGAAAGGAAGIARGLGAAAAAGRAASGAIGGRAAGAAMTGRGAGAATGALGGLGKTAKQMPFKAGTPAKISPLPLAKGPAKIQNMKAV